MIVYKHGLKVKGGSLYLNLCVVLSSTSSLGVSRYGGLGRDPSGSECWVGEKPFSKDFSVTALLANVQ